MTKTSLIVRVAQITDGNPVCYCGAPAVLVVTTEPDQDPGPTCFVHAMEWIQGSLRMAHELFGPNASESHAA